MAKKNQSDSDLDSFLDDFDAKPDDVAPAEDVEDLVPVDEFQTSFEEDYAEVDPEDAEIARLQEELRTAAQPPKRVAVTRPVPESKLTPKQRQIRDLQDQIARRKAAAIEAAEPEYDEEEGETLLINFVSDGFTAFGQTWYTGQELEFHIGGEDYELTRDLQGNSWLELDEDQQFELYGKVIFRRGPWRGKRLSPDQMSPEERRRARRVPINF